MSLADAASELLAAAHDALGDDPARLEMVCVGQAAYYCDNLLAAVLRPLRPYGLGALEPYQRAMPTAWSAEIDLVILGCAPTADEQGADAPAPDAVTAAAVDATTKMEKVLSRVETMIAAAVDATGAALVLGGTCTAAGVSSVTPIDPQGGIQGWAVTVTLGLAYPDNPPA